MSEPIVDTAKINLKDVSQRDAVDIIKHLIDSGYSVKYNKDLSTDCYEIYSEKKYIVNPDPAETKLFRKLVETFDKAIDFLQKEDILISIDHSVGAIDISVRKTNKDYQ